jgi:uncharacterized HAD superfamily protein
MKIGIDMDSVLADITSSLNAFHNERYGTQCKVEDYLDYDLSTIWKCAPDEAYERVYAFYESPFMDMICDQWCS